MKRGRRPRLAGWLDERYQSGGLPYLRRALHAQLALGFVVALVGAALTLLYTPKLSAADLAIISAISLCIYVADAALALRPLRAHLIAVERFEAERDETSALE